MRVATADADTLIVNTAIHAAMTETTVVVGEDVDLLVLLIGKTPPEEATQLFFLRPPMGKKQPETIYEIATQQAIPNIKDGSRIISAHAMSGCNTTSCSF